MARRVSGLRSLWIAVGASAVAVCVVSAQAPDARTRFTGTWQHDAARSVEDKADWWRLTQPIRRSAPCINSPLRQEDWMQSPGHPYWGGRDCYVEQTENDRRRKLGAPGLRVTTEVITPRLGVSLMIVLPELRTEATATAAVVAGAPDSEPIAFSTTGKRTTVPIDTHQIHLTASWRNGDLVQVLSGKDQDIDFRVRRTFTTSADGRTLTVTTRVEKPKLTPAVKDVVHVFTRSR